MVPVCHKQKLLKNNFCWPNWKPLKKRAGSESRSVIQWYWSADPDPNQNVTRYNKSGTLPGTVRCRNAIIGGCGSGNTGFQTIGTPWRNQDQILISSQQTVKRSRIFFDPVIAISTVPRVRSQRHVPVLMSNWRKNVLRYFAENFHVRIRQYQLIDPSITNLSTYWPFDYF